MDPIIDKVAIKRIKEIEKAMELVWGSTGNLNCDDAQLLNEVRATWKRLARRKAEYVLDLVKEWEEGED